MRKKQQEVTSAGSSLRDLIVSLVFATSVIAIGYAEFDFHSFRLQQNIRNYLISDGYGQFGFSAVSNAFPDKPVKAPHLHPLI
jgi:uncharacterized protein involved in cysteine biosynthesis